MHILRTLALVAFALVGPLASTRAENSAPASPSVPAASRHLAPGSDIEIGMWVWDREDIATAAERTRLLEFSRDRGIRRLLVQVHYDRAGDGYALAMPEAWRALLADCARERIAVEALDAGAENVFAEARANTLALLRSILEFNQAQPREARFAGVHFDFEPYISDRWRVAGQQGPIMREFLDTARAIRDLVRASESSLTIAYDIPSWFDQEQFALEFGGERKFLSQHLQDLSDYVGIMSYRTRATGPNSAADISAGELAYGVRIGRPVYLSLETVPLPETPDITFHGRSPAEYIATIRELAAFRATESARGGILLHYYRTIRALLEADAVLAGGRGAGE